MSSGATREQGMTSSAIIARRPDAATSPRLSPKVRRLLREHDLEPTDVTGTGTRGRITPGDVDRTARGDHGRRPTTPPRRGRALASPLARRLLRDAGLGPEDIAATGPVTADLARREIDRARGRDVAVGDAPGTVTIDLDLTRLLHGVGRLHQPVLRRTGIELTPLAPLAHAVCRALRRHPGVHAPDRPDQQRDVDLALVQPAADGAVTTVVACAQDLTVPALAARAAHGRAGQDADPAAHASFALVGDGWGDTPDGSRVDSPLRLTLSAAEQRQVAGADEFGGATTSTRWIASAHLAYDASQLGAGPVEQFLDDLRRELETVDLLAAVT